jgi:hypothetical protein
VYIRELNQDRNQRYSYNQIRVTREVGTIVCEEGEVSTGRAMPIDQAIRRELAWQELARTEDAALSELAGWSEASEVLADRALWKVRDIEAHVGEVLYDLLLAKRTEILAERVPTSGPLVDRDVLARIVRPPGRRVQDPFATDFVLRLHPYPWDPSMPRWTGAPYLRGYAPLGTWIDSPVRISGWHIRAFKFVGRVPMILRIP